MKVEYFDVEFTQEEHDKWIEGWNLEKLHEELPSGAFKTFIENRTKLILEDRRDKQVEPLIAVLQKYLALYWAGLEDRVEPDLAQTMPSQAKVNDWFNRLIDYFRNELYVPGTEIVKNYWLDKGIDTIPPYNEFGGRLRLATYLEYHRAKKEQGL